MKLRKADKHWWDLKLRKADKHGWDLGGPAALAGAAIAASFYHFKLVLYDICTKNVHRHSNRTLRAGTI
jgi:hypothetical protein